MVAALNSPHPNLALYGHLIEDVKFLTNGLVSSCFTHVKRQGNAMAHALARMAINTANTEVWMEDVPPQTKSLYLSEFPV